MNSDCLSQAFRLRGQILRLQRLTAAFICETAEETRDLDAEEAETGPPISTYTTTLATSGSGSLLDTANRAHIFCNM
jgi:hypothetical protein